MNALTDSPAVLRRFDDLCTLIGRRGSGLTLAQLGAAHALAYELERGPERDPLAVRLFLRDLRLTHEEVER